MIEITQENRIIDIPSLNRFQIGDQVIVDASADNDRFEGVIIGIELQRLYGSSYLAPSITLLHDGYITDGFKPGDCRKVEAPSPQPNVLVFPRELTDDLRDILSMMMWNTGPIAHALRAGGVEIKTRAEEEQAHVMHWLITLALEHGAAWREKASERISEIRAALATTEGSDNG